MQIEKIIIGKNYKFFAIKDDSGKDRFYVANAGDFTIENGGRYHEIDAYSKKLSAVVNRLVDINAIPMRYGSAYGDCDVFVPDVDCNLSAACAINGTMYLMSEKTSADFVHPVNSSYFTALSSIHDATNTYTLSSVAPINSYLFSGSEDIVQNTEGLTKYRDFSEFMRLDAQMEIIYEFILQKYGDITEYLKNNSNFEQALSSILIDDYIGYLRDMGQVYESEDIRFAKLVIQSFLDVIGSDGVNSSLSWEEHQKFLRSAYERTIGTYFNSQKIVDVIGDVNSVLDWAYQQVLSTEIEDGKDYGGSQVNDYGNTYDIRYLNADCLNEIKQSQVIQNDIGLQNTYVDTVKTELSNLIQKIQDIQEYIETNYSVFHKSLNNGTNTPEAQRDFDRYIKATFDEKSVFVKALIIYAYTMLSNTGRWYGTGQLAKSTARQIMNDMLNIYERYINIAGKTKDYSTHVTRTIRKNYLYSNDSKTYSNPIHISFDYPDGIDLQGNRFFSPKKYYGDDFNLSAAIIDLSSKIDYDRLSYHSVKISETGTNTYIKRGTLSVINEIVKGHEQWEKSTFKTYDVSDAVYISDQYEYVCINQERLCAWVSLCSDISEVQREYCGSTVKIEANEISAPPGVDKYYFVGFLQNDVDQDNLMRPIKKSYDNIFNRISAYSYNPKKSAGASGSNTATTVNLLKTIQSYTDESVDDFKVFKGSGKEKINLYQDNNDYTVNICCIFPPGTKYNELCALGESEMSANTLNGYKNFYNYLGEEQYVVLSSTDPQYREIITQLTSNTTTIKDNIYTVTIADILSSYAISRGVSYDTVVTYEADRILLSTVYVNDVLDWTNDISSIVDKPISSLLADHFINFYVNADRLPLFFTYTDSSTYKNGWRLWDIVSNTPWFKADDRYKDLAKLSDMSKIKRHKYLMDIANYQLSDWSYFSGSERRKGFIESADFSLAQAITSTDGTKIFNRLCAVPMIDIIPTEGMEVSVLGTPQYEMTDTRLCIIDATPDRIPDFNNNPYSPTDQNGQALTGFEYSRTIRYNNIVFNSYKISLYDKEYETFSTDDAGNCYVLSSFVAAEGLPAPMYFVNRPPIGTVLNSDGSLTYTWNGSTPSIQYKNYDIRSQAYTSSFSYSAGGYIYDIPQDRVSSIICSDIGTIQYKMSDGTPDCVTDILYKGPIVYTDGYGRVQYVDSTNFGRIIQNIPYNGIHYVTAQNKNHKITTNIFKNVLDEYYRYAKYMGGAIMPAVLTANTKTDFISFADMLASRSHNTERWEDNVLRMNMYLTYDRSPLYSGYIGNLFQNDLSIRMLSSMLTWEFFNGVDGEQTIAEYHRKAINGDTIKLKSNERAKLENLRRIYDAMTVVNLTAVPASTANLSSYLYHWEDDPAYPEKWELLTAKKTSQQNPWFLKIRQYVPYSGNYLTGDADWAFDQRGYLQYDSASREVQDFPTLGTAGAGVDANGVQNYIMHATYDYQINVAENSYYDGHFEKKYDLKEKIIGSDYAKGKRTFSLYTSHRRSPTTTLSRIAVSDKISFAYVLPSEQTDEYGHNLYEIRYTLKNSGEAAVYTLSESGQYLKSIDDLDEYTYYTLEESKNFTDVACEFPAEGNAELTALAYTRYEIDESAFDENTAIAVCVPDSVDALPWYDREVKFYSEYLRTDVTMINPPFSIKSKFYLYNNGYYLKSLKDNGLYTDPTIEYGGFRGANVIYRESGQELSPGYNGKEVFYADIRSGKWIYYKKGVYDIDIYRLNSKYITDADFYVPIPGLNEDSNYNDLTSYTNQIFDSNSGKFSMFGTEYTKNSATNLNIWQRIQYLNFTQYLKDPDYTLNTPIYTALSSHIARDSHIDQLFSDNNPETLRALLTRKNYNVRSQLGLRFADYAQNYQNIFVPNIDVKTGTIDLCREYLPIIHVYCVKGNTLGWVTIKEDHSAEITGSSESMTQEDYINSQNSIREILQTGKVWIDKNQQLSEQKDDASTAYVVAGAANLQRVSAKVITITVRNSLTLERTRKSAQIKYLPVSWDFNTANPYSWVNLSAYKYPDGREMANDKLVEMYPDLGDGTKGDNPPEIVRLIRNLQRDTKRKRSPAGGWEEINTDEHPLITWYNKDGSKQQLQAEISVVANNSPKKKDSSFYYMYYNASSMNYRLNDYMSRMTQILSANSNSILNVYSNYSYLYNIVVESLTKYFAQQFVKNRIYDSLSSLYYDVLDQIDYDIDKSYTSVYDGDGNEVSRDTDGMYQNNSKIQFMYERLRELYQKYMPELSGIIKNLNSLRNTALSSYHMRIPHKYISSDTMLKYSIDSAVDPAVSENTVSNYVKTGFLRYSNYDKLQRQALSAIGMYNSEFLTDLDLATQNEKFKEKIFGHTEFKFSDIDIQNLQRPVSVYNVDDSGNYMSNIIDGYNLAGSQVSSLSVDPDTGFLSYTLSDSTSVRSAFKVAGTNSEADSRGFYIYTVSSYLNHDYDDLSTFSQILMGNYSQVSDKVYFELKDEIVDNITDIALSSVFYTWENMTSAYDDFEFAYYMQHVNDCYSSYLLQDPNSELTYSKTKYACDMDLLDDVKIDYTDDLNWDKVAYKDVSKNTFSKEFKLFDHALKEDAKSSVQQAVRAFRYANLLNYFKNNIHEYVQNIMDQGYLRESLNLINNALIVEIGKLLTANMVQNEAYQRKVFQYVGSGFSEYVFTEGRTWNIDSIKSKFKTQFSKDLFQYGNVEIEDVRENIKNAIRDNIAAVNGAFYADICEAITRNFGALLEQAYKNIPYKLDISSLVRDGDVREGLTQYTTYLFNTDKYENDVLSRCSDVEKQNAPVYNTLSTSLNFAIDNKIGNAVSAAFYNTRQISFNPSYIYDIVFKNNMVSSYRDNAADVAASLTAGSQPQFQSLNQMLSLRYNELLRDITDEHQDRLSSHNVISEIVKIRSVLSNLTYNYMIEVPFNRQSDQLRSGCLDVNPAITKIPYDQNYSTNVSGDYVFCNLRDYNSVNVCGNTVYLKYRPNVKVSALCSDTLMSSDIAVYDMRSQTKCRDKIDSADHIEVLKSIDAEVENVSKHRSNVYSINIINAGISSDITKQVIRNKVNTIVEQLMPMNTQIYDIRFEN